MVSMQDTVYLNMLRRDNELAETRRNDAMLEMSRQLEGIRGREDRLRPSEGAVSETRPEDRLGALGYDTAKAKAAQEAAAAQAKIDEREDVQLHQTGMQTSDITGKKDMAGAQRDWVQQYKFPHDKDLADIRGEWGQRAAAANSQGRTADKLFSIRMGALGKRGSDATRQILGSGLSKPQQAKAAAEIQRLTDAAQGHLMMGDEAGFQALMGRLAAMAKPGDLALQGGQGATGDIGHGELE